MNVAMERCTGSILEDFLNSYGWTYRALGNDEWRTGFQGQEQSYPLHIRLLDSWISFQITPYLGLEIDWDSWPEIARWLLELNGSSSLVRLSLSESGAIELGMEVLNTGFSYESFSTSMGILGFYADFFYDEILSRLDAIGYRYSDSLRLLT